MKHSRLPYTWVNQPTLQYCNKLQKWCLDKKVAAGSTRKGLYISRAMSDMRTLYRFRKDQ